MDVAKESERHWAAASIWFESWEGRESGFKTFILFRVKFSKKCRFPRKNLVINFKKWKNFCFQDKIRLLHLQMHKLFSFIFKSHHFPTYLLCIITSNNISVLVHDPNDPPATLPTTPSPKSRGHDAPNPQD